jgi:hypothetical protein
MFGYIAKGNLKTRIHRNVAGLPDGLLASFSDGLLCFFAEEDAFL